MRMIPIVLMAERAEDWFVEEEGGEEELRTFFRLKVNDNLVAESIQPHNDYDDDDLQLWVAEILKGLFHK